MLAADLHVQLIDLKRFGLEAPPDLNREWRFCRAIPGGFRAIEVSDERARNRRRSVGSADGCFLHVVFGVG